MSTPMTARDAVLDSIFGFILLLLFAALAVKG
jgi:hypothetical protein